LFDVLANWFSLFLVAFFEPNFSLPCLPACQ